MRLREIGSLVVAVLLVSMSVERQPFAADEVLSDHLDLCVFRTKSATHSDVSRPPIPDKAATLWHQRRDDADLLRRI